MNDIEKQIEGEEKESKEESHIKLNRNNKKNKTIVYILGGVIILLLIATIIYLVIINRENKNKNSEPSSSDTIKNEVEENYIYYVSCDDNTALLNVRNSTSGDIIDGLSCYKQVNIEEELEKTEACDKWYKINYKKRESNYTGYACGTYIKKVMLQKMK